MRSYRSVRAALSDRCRYARQLRYPHSLVSRCARYGCGVFKPIEISERFVNKFFPMSRIEPDLGGPEPRRTNDIGRHESSEPRGRRFEFSRPDFLRIRRGGFPVFKPDIRDDERSGEVILRLIELKNGTRLPECGSIDRKVCQSCGIAERQNDAIRQEIIRNYRVPNEARDRTIHPASEPFRIPLSGCGVLEKGMKANHTRPERRASNSDVRLLLVDVGEAPPRVGNLGLAADRWKHV